MRTLNLTEIQAVSGGATPDFKNPVVLFNLLTYPISAILALLIMGGFFPQFPS